MCSTVKFQRYLVYIYIYIYKCKEKKRTHFYLKNIGYFGSLTRNSRNHTNYIKTNSQRLEQLELSVKELKTIALDTREMMKNFER